MGSYKILGAIGIAIALATGALAGPLYSDGLIAYYSFDNGAELGADGSINGYDGTIVGSVSGVSGKLGCAASFASAGLNYLDLPVADISLDNKIPTSNFTLAAWCKVDENGSQAIFNARASDDTWLIHPEIRSSDYRFTLRDYDMDGIGSIYPGASDDNYPIFGEWQHIAMTYDRSANTMAVYINGELLEEKTDCADLNMAADWDLGARIGVNIDNARQYIGLMDELYLFNRTLSANEIGALASVPEPASIGLAISAALAGLLFWKKRKR